MSLVEQRDETGVAMGGGEPVPEGASNRVVVLFLDEPPPNDALTGVVAPDGEALALQARGDDERPHAVTLTRGAPALHRVSERA